MKINNKDIVLAIETGIGGGSVCVLRDFAQVGSWIGDSKVSKSEDVLRGINNIFEENDLIKTDIGHIVISNNPGSLTGLRIGLSIALGLKNAVRAEFTQISTFEALKFLTEGEDFLIAFPVGHKIAWQIFEDSKLLQPFSDVFENFVELIALNRSTKFILHKNIYDRIPPNKHIYNAGDNVAYLIGEYFYRNASDNELPVL